MGTGSDYRGPTFEVILKWFRAAMALVYIALGIAILLKSEELFRVPSSYAIALGFVLIGYGLIRGYRAIQRDF